MPVDKKDIQQAGRRRAQEDDEEVVSDKTRKKRAQVKGKAALAPLPAPLFKSTIAAVAAVEGYDCFARRSTAVVLILPAHSCLRAVDFDAGRQCSVEYFRHTLAPGVIPT